MRETAEPALVQESPRRWRVAQLAREATQSAPQRLCVAGRLPEQRGETVAQRTVGKA